MPDGSIDTMRCGPSTSTSVLSPESASAGSGCSSPCCRGPSRPHLAQVRVRPGVASLVESEPLSVASIGHRCRRHRTTQEQREERKQGEDFGQCGGVLLWLGSWHERRTSSHEPSFLEGGRNVHRQATGLVHPTEWWHHRCGTVPGSHRIRRWRTAKSVCDVGAMRFIAVTASSTMRRQFLTGREVFDNANALPGR